jgi:hypothetical protein
MTIKESGRILPHPSAYLPCDNLDGHPWVAHTLSQSTSIKRGKVSIGVYYPGYYGSPITAQNYGSNRFLLAANDWGTIQPITDKDPPL